MSDCGVGMGGCGVGNGCGAGAGAGGDGGRSCGLLVASAVVGDSKTFLPLKNFSRELGLPTATGNSQSLR